MPHTPLRLDVELHSLPDLQQVFRQKRNVAHLKKIDPLAVRGMRGGGGWGGRSRTRLQNMQRCGGMRSQAAASARTITARSLSAAPHGAAFQAGMRPGRAKSNNLRRCIYASSASAYLSEHMDGTVGGKGPPPDQNKGP